MDARFYQSEEIDIQRLANDLENMYRMQGYEVQQVGNKDQMMVQLKKGSDLVALIGMQTALRSLFGSSLTEWTGTMLGWLSLPSVRASRRPLHETLTATRRWPRAGSSAR